MGGPVEDAKKAARLDPWPKPGVKPRPGRRSFPERMGSQPPDVFWTLSPIGQVLMVLAVLWLLSTRSWRLMLLLLAMQFSAHMNTGYNGPPAERPHMPANPDISTAVDTSLRTV